MTAQQQGHQYATDMLGICGKEWRKATAITLIACAEVKRKAGVDIEYQDAVIERAKEVLA